jgi:low affinity Fe/Cu permease
MHDTLNIFSRRIYNFVSTPAALILAFASILLWALSGPRFHFSGDWLMIVNSGGTIVTFLMVFVLNNAQSRDTMAINAKLDMLILAVEGADNRLVGVEGKSVEETREVREHLASVVAGAESAAADAQNSADDAQRSADDSESSARER